MGITVQWDDEEQTIIRYAYEGKWDWDDLHRAVTQAYQMVAQENHKIGVLIDLSASAGLPPNAMSHAKSLMAKQHPAVVFTVVVGSNSFIKVLSDSFIRVYGTLGGYTDTRFVNTLDEGRTMINHKLQSPH